MKHRALFLITALVIVAALHCYASDIRTVTILHTNDIHAQTAPDAKGIGGYATIAAYIKGVKAKQDNVLVLDAGDQISGSPVSLLWKGRPIYEMMNQIAYDAAVIGNHELDLGWSMVREYMDIAKFPLLCANIYTAAGLSLGDAPSITLVVNGVRIGVVGLTTSALPTLVAAKNIEGLDIRDEMAVMRDQLRMLEGEADIIVVLSHCGTELDRRLPQALDGIDVIIGSHDHMPLLEPEVVNGTIIVQSMAYGRYVGRLDLDIDMARGKVAAHRGQHVKMDSKVVGSDSATAAVVRKWEDKVSGMVDVPIGTSTIDKTPSELSRIIGAILKERFKTDYGFQADGSTRSDLPAGTISKRRIWNMLPFGNTVTVIRVEKGIVEHLLQSKLPPGGPDLYTIATSTYLAQKICDVFKLPPERQIHHPAILREVIIEYIIENGSLFHPDEMKALDKAA